MTADAWLSLVCLAVGVAVLALILGARTERAYQRRLQEHIKRHAPDLNPSPQAEAVTAPTVPTIEVKTNPSPAPSVPGVPVYVQTPPNWDQRRN